MKNEIEHKFLINKSRLPKFSKLKKGDHCDGGRYRGKAKIVQGYISRNPVVRVRILDDDEAILTIKGKGSRVRQEFEYNVPVAHAKELMKLCAFQISKIRHYIGRWEIDEFRGPHKGLWLAEIEMETEECKLPILPGFVGPEVTYDKRFTNASLAEAGKVP